MSAMYQSQDGFGPGATQDMRLNWRYVMSSESKNQHKSGMGSCGKKDKPSSSKTSGQEASKEALTEQAGPPHAFAWKTCLECHSSEEQKTDTAAPLHLDQDRLALSATQCQLNSILVRTLSFWRRASRHHMLFVDLQAHKRAYVSLYVILLNTTLHISNFLATPLWPLLQRKSDEIGRGEVTTGLLKFVGLPWPCFHSPRELTCGKPTWSLHSVIIHKICNTRDY